MRALLETEVEEVSGGLFLAPGDENHPARIVQALEDQVGPLGPETGGLYEVWTLSAQG
ncbi:MAG: hypothetical protein AAF385_15605 [Pseudomonadota bacterium]